MIEKDNLFRIFEEIDSILTKKNTKPHEIIIYGGASLIAMGHANRATVDVDVFKPKLSKDLKDVAQMIAKKYLFDEKWLNSTGRAFINELPSGWEKRLIVVYSGKSFTVKSLGRIDIIFTKFLAELDRAEDLADLIQLKPSREELNIVIPDLIKLEKKNSLWQKKIDEIKIKILQGVDYGS